MLMLMAGNRDTAARYLERHRSDTPDRHCSKTVVLCCRLDSWSSLTACTTLRPIDVVAEVEREKRADTAERLGDKIR